MPGTSSWNENTEISGERGRNMTHLCIFNLPSSAIMGIPLHYPPAGWKVQGEGKIRATECTEGDTDASWHKLWRRF